MEALRLAHVSRTCGDVRALRGVSVSFRSGELHALVGENGAGKSTLLKIAAGIMVPDEGEVFVEGKKLSPHSAAEAIKRGVGMVQQHFALVEALSVLENLVLGAEPGSALGRLDFGESAVRARKLLADLGFGFRLDTKIERLGVGDRQRVEIARVLFKKARTVILDEPTAVLTAYEAHALYGMLQRLARSGRAVVVVTHKLDEVVSYCDHVTVLRRGVLISSRALGDRSTRSLADTQPIALDVMGGRLPDALPPTPQAPGGSALVLKDVRFGRALRGVSLELHASEIVGVAGIEGNGQHELVRVIAGLDKPDSGLVWPKQEEGKRRASVVFEDRQREGLVLEASVKDNLVLGELAVFSSLGIVNTTRIMREATVRRERSGLDSPDLERSAASFSGGNQQKIVMARAIARVQEGGVLVVAHPTRGVDLGAAHAIHAQILEVASAKKVAVLVLSSDLAELRALSSRILVLSKGRIVAELSRTASDVEIGEHMLLDHPAPPPSLRSPA